MKFFLITLSLIMLTFSAEAQKFETQVHIALEAENQALAKDEALKQAYRKAFLEIGQQLATPAQMTLLESLDDTQLSHFIRETSVLSERGRGNTYEADFVIKINDSLLNQFLEENAEADFSAQNHNFMFMPHTPDNAHFGASNNTITVIFHYNRLKDWLNTQATLNALPQVKKLETGGLSGGKVQMSIQYVGAFESFQKALEQKGFTLLERDGFYVLQ